MTRLTFISGTFDGLLVEHMHRTIPFMRVRSYQIHIVKKLISVQRVLTKAHGYRAAERGLVEIAIRSEVRIAHPVMFGEMHSAVPLVFFPGEIIEVRIGFYPEPRPSRATEWPQWVWQRVRAAWSDLRETPSVDVVLEGLEAA